MSLQSGLNKRRENEILYRMETIIISEYSPDWTRHFELLYNEIWPQISDVALSLEHVGSTSVVGLPAKAIIDLTIITSSKENLKIIIKRLAAIGAEHRGDLGIEGREAFTRLGGFPVHNLYACIVDSEALKNHLVIRDSLRDNAELIEKYGALKLKLAKQHSQDIDSYVEGKTSFLLNVLKDHGLGLGELEDIKSQNINQNKNYHNTTQLL